MLEKSRLFSVPIRGTFRIAKEAWQQKVSIWASLGERLFLPWRVHSMAYSPLILRQACDQLSWRHEQQPSITRHWTPIWERDLFLQAYGFILGPVLQLPQSKGVFLPLSSLRWYLRLFDLIIQV